MTYEGCGPSKEFLSRQQQEASASNRHGDGKKQVVQVQKHTKDLKKNIKPIQNQKIKWSFKPVDMGGKEGNYRKNKSPNQKKLLLEEGNQHKEKLIRSQKHHWPLSTKAKRKLISSKPHVCCTPSEQVGAIHQPSGYSIQIFPSTIYKHTLLYI